LIENVVEKFLSDLRLSLAEKQIELVYPHEVVSYLADVGFDPIYGARPISRKIDQLIKSQLVDEILFGRLKNGGKVEVSLKSAAQQKTLQFDFESANSGGKKMAAPKATKKEPV